MKKLIVFSCVLISLLLMAGCASVNFYSDPDLKNETGLRYYTLKPYLLVEYQAEKDNTVKTTIVYLPDVSSPQYMVLKPGLGSNDLKMSFSNSALETYGIVSESQLPETLEAFAAMLSKSAYAAQAFTGPQATATEGGPVFKLFEIIYGQDGATLKEINGL
ncbi:MAG TPA: hypothetical protein VMV74_04930 [Bacteroidales bacterium]|nr:hypothetical protein [Bacteroidales bacterium]